jgi:hypothetical protein
MKGIDPAFILLFINKLYIAYNKKTKSKSPYECSPMPLFFKGRGSGEGF